MPEPIADVLTTQASVRPRILVSCSLSGPANDAWLIEDLTDYADNVGQELRAQGADFELLDVGAAASWEMDAATGLQGFDGLLVLGGGDIHPSLYGQRPIAAPGYGVDERVDQAEIALVRSAAASGLPVMGICRGMQVINVAFGGTLIQDLGPASIHQVHTEAPGMSDHEVVIGPDTLLASALGAGSTMVRSGHHQAVQDLGAGLLATAEAPDGVIEAIEHEDHWVLGVQWHPEDPDTTFGQLAALMRTFTDQCRKGQPPAAHPDGQTLSA
ncbi:gamma-glutamyl-gamma-aminobutyrate hydrolase family protein [Arthrobacter sulfonylureivorans]|uniref:Gamma-glutamyl-gamma-aminobutyrate hydrolase family protein n=1 Tax=Arthrobacter sulfonylureivorans TaxID=2486855 RepID=A0ABY3W6T2_9MICC|nr:gamma-glutamyl-gamma-aminobutyrate hydrolase family protein [Arthrobacter sulfonylureivorans]UNK45191.1 gamma-glutamyl-gamma-aminobutyrate hydrolase family protein [Arthrobacter sulfonylureivorans]